MNDKKKKDVGDWINIISLLILALIIAIAIKQGFFEEQKCSSWAEERIFEIQTGLPNQNYNCSLDCSENLALKMQEINYADKSANWFENE